MRGKGSAFHRLLQEAIAERYRAQGKVAIIEADIREKKVDVLVLDGYGASLAVEIHLHRHWEQLELQVRKNASRNLRIQLVVVPDGLGATAREYLDIHLPYDTRKGVRVCSVSDIFQGNDCAEVRVMPRNNPRNDGDGRKGRRP